MNLDPHRPKITREEAIRNAGRALADVLDRLDDKTPRQAALDAHRRGGPSVNELETRIAASRKRPD